MGGLETLIYGGLGGAVMGYLAGVFTARVELKKGIAEDTRLLRKQAYKQLWELSGRLPRYPGSEELGIKKLGDLYDLSVDMSNWYFNSDGGLIMSERTKKRYMKTQQTIEYLLLEATGPKATMIDRQKVAGMSLKRENYLKIQKKFSALRTAMTRDLLSRNRRYI